MMSEGEGKGTHHVREREKGRNYLPHRKRDLGRGIRNRLKGPQKRREDKVGVPSKIETRREKDAQLERKGSR